VRSDNVSKVALARMKSFSSDYIGRNGYCGTSLFHEFMAFLSHCDLHAWYVVALLNAAISRRSRAVSNVTYICMNVDTHMHIRTYV
jgi:hypothetical protein